MLRRQQREADLAGLELDVRVADGRDEFDLGWLERVFSGDGDVEEPEAAVVGRAADAAKDGFPVEEVVVGDGAEVQEGLVWGRGVVLDLVDEALGCGVGRVGRGAGGRWFGHLGRVLDESLSSSSGLGENGSQEFNVLGVAVVSWVALCRSHAEKLHIKGEMLRRIQRSLPPLSDPSPPTPKQGSNLEYQCQIWLTTPARRGGAEETSDPGNGDNAGMRCRV